MRSGVGEPTDIQRCLTTIEIADVLIHVPDRGRGGGGGGGGGSKWTYSGEPFLISCASRVSPSSAFETFTDTGWQTKSNSYLDAKVCGKTNKEESVEN